MSSTISSPVRAGVEDLADRDRQLQDANKKQPGRSSIAESAEGIESRPLPASRKSGQLLSRSNTASAPKDKDAKQQQQGVSLDPLSTQIFLRTTSNTEQPSIAQRLRTSGARPDSPVDVRNSVESQQAANGVFDSSREKKKGPSFLSRFSMRSPWQRDDDAADTDSDIGELRLEGSHARVLTSVNGAGGGFMPSHKEPTRYIRVRPHNKKVREFNRLFLAQELTSRGRSPSAGGDGSPSRATTSSQSSHTLHDGNAIWAAEFSVDGKYLAVAGRDQVVRVYSVLSTPEERMQQEEEEEQHHAGQPGEKLRAPVFRTKPAREFRGHSGEVLALSWSKNNFLLSSSMDKTVRLWHLSRDECLCTFKHDDLVTSIAFHPTDDRFFLAGSLDAQLRLWSIPDKDVAFVAHTQEFITAVAFSPDGKMSICGLLSGLCMFYKTEGLKLSHHIHAKSSRGKNAKGSKITGIRTAMEGKEGKDVRVLISSNDSRVRIYSMKTRMLEVKLKGLENQSSQIHARFSDDGNYIISGSEDRKAYIWNMDAVDIENRDKQPYECFDAHPDVVTTALLAPTQTRELLGQSGDPVYELCNPPPVTLCSLDETASHSVRNSDHQTDSLRGGKVDGRKTEYTPAYLKRSKHPDGQILVTTDRNGSIKVFRQDCAYIKRQQSWETGSRFSGRFTGVGRSGSVLTRTSAGSRANSRRASLSSAHQPQLASDRIMSWRQDVEGGPRGSQGEVSLRTERSMSPMKSANRSPRVTSPTGGLSMVEKRRQTYAHSPTLRTPSGTSPSSSVRRVSVRPTKEGLLEAEPTLPPTPSFSLVSASGSSDHDEREGSFWNLSRWRGLSGLRYSSTSNSLGAGPATGGPSSPTQSTEGARNSTSLPPDSSSRQGGGRRSLALNRMGRVNGADQPTSKEKEVADDPSARE